MHAKCKQTKVKLANYTFCLIKAFLVNILTSVNNLLGGFAYLGEYDSLFNYGLEVKRKYNKYIDISCVLSQVQFRFSSLKWRVCMVYIYEEMKKA